MVDRRTQTGDMGVLFRGAFRGFAADIWTSMPGVVVDYDAAKMVCQVQPMIQARIANPDGTAYWKKLPVCLDCPIMFPGAGGFTLTFPVRPGDECLLVFASRCIDSWWQSGPGPKMEGQIQAEFRMHDLSDGFVVLGPRSQPRVLTPSPNAADVQLRSDDGATSISISPDGTVGVVAAGDVVVVAGGNMRATASAFTLTGPVRIEGDLFVNGNIGIPGLPTYGDHRHGGIQPGTGLSNGPESGT